MKPCEKLVQVLAELVVQLVILGHTRKGGLDHHALGADDKRVHLLDHAIGDGLAVANTGIHPLSHHVTIGNYASGDYGGRKDRPSHFRRDQRAARTIPDCSLPHNRAEILPLPPVPRMFWTKSSVFFPWTTTLPLS